MAMSKELDRVATYTLWPDNAKMSPLTLAKVGFFYAGNEDEVECFRCKIRLKGWTGSEHDPVARHRQAAPHCPLLNETCIDNFTLDSCVTTSNNNNNNNSIKTRSQTESDNAGVIIDTVSDLYTNSDLSAVNSIYNQALSRAQKNGLFQNRNVSTIDRNNPDFLLLRGENQRLNTFFDWPSTANVSPVDLAREGFFYKGTADRVQCVYCQGFIRSWEPGDNPRTEHRRHFPNCPSFCEIGHLISECNTVDRGENLAVRQPFETNALHANGSNPILGSITTERGASRQPASGDAPKYPQYFEYSVRVASFRNGITAVGQTAEGLAEAGWFYVGPNDKVRCFQCGGNLRDWEPDDDPWAEHSRWYENCQYVRTHRPPANRSTVQENSIPTVRTDIVSHDIEPREIKTQLDTPAVRAVLSMGYTLDKVKDVIELKLSITGEDFPNAESLLDALFQLEEAEETANAGAVALTLEPVNNLSSSVSSISSRSSGYSTLSSSSSSSSFSESNNNRISLKPETAVMLSPIPEAIQTKSKVAKKKKTKKKKGASSSSAAAISENATAQGLGEEEPNLLEKVLLDEHGLEEIRDEDAVRCLEEENRLMHEQRTCKVCMDAEVNTVFLPCGHLVCCATCSPQLRNCPMCRTFIRGTVKTYLS